MIDRCKKIADACQFLRIPAVLLGSICLVTITVLLISSNTREEEFFAIPSLVGLLWSMATYAFLIYFRVVPEKADASWNFINRAKRKVIRAWYWLVAIVFVVTTLGMIFMSYRMITVWMQDFS